MQQQLLSTRASLALSSRLPYLLPDKRVRFDPAIQRTRSRQARDAIGRRPSDTAGACIVTCVQAVRQAYLHEYPHAWQSESSTTHMNSEASLYSVHLRRSHAAATAGQDASLFRAHRPRHSLLSPITEREREREKCRKVQGESTAQSKHPHEDEGTRVQACSSLSCVTWGDVRQQMCSITWRKKLSH